MGIAGGTGSGKSWLTEQLVKQLRGRAAVIQMDWYYRDRSGIRGKARLNLNFDHPGAIETPLLVSHLRQLLRGAAVDTPRYDYATHSRSKRSVAVAPKSVIIVEGLFVLHEASVRKWIDYGVFIDVPADERLILRLKRDHWARNLNVFETLRLYENFARPMHDKFVQPSAKKADEIWAGLPTRKRLLKLSARLKKRLK